MKTVVLIGPPDCGKTTLGQLVAEKLGMPFMGTDKEVAKKFKERSSSGSFFDLLHSFQALEQEVVLEIAIAQAQGGEPMIVSTGAETALSPINAPLLKQIGYVILIRRDKETLKEELVREKRRRWVMVTDKGEESTGFFTDMYFEEMAQYESIADAVLENDFGIENGLASLIEIINAIPEI